MHAKVIFGRKGQKKVVDHLEFVCKNPETGCSYKVKSFSMCSDMMIALRPDGSEVRVGE